MLECIFEIILRCKKYRCEEQITLDAVREELISDIGVYGMKECCDFHLVLWKKIHWLTC